MPLRALFILSVSVETVFSPHFCWKPLLPFHGHSEQTFLWSIVLTVPVRPLLSLTEEQLAWGHRGQATGLTVTQIPAPCAPMLNTLMISNSQSWHPACSKLIPNLLQPAFYLVLSISRIPQRSCLALAFILSWHWRLNFFFESGSLLYTICTQSCVASLSFSVRTLYQ